MTRARIVLGTILVTAPAVALACVLADAPPIATPKPFSRPVILHDAVSPSLDQKILAPPTSSSTLNFVVPVQLDPDQAFQWRVFVDLDPNAPPPGVDGVIKRTNDGGVVAEVPDASDVTQTLTFALSASLPIDFTKCHTFTIVVAYGFQETYFSEPISPPGGDRATWFYEPLSDCTLDDAAPPTSFDGGLD